MLIYLCLKKKKKKFLLWVDACMSLFCIFSHIFAIRLKSLSVVLLSFLNTVAPSNNRQKVCSFGSLYQNLVKRYNLFSLSTTKI